MAVPKNGIVFEDSHDNRLRAERVAKGLSARDLGRICGIGCESVYSLERGYTGPIDVRGKIKKWVEIACIFLEKEFEDVFPRDVCSIRTDADPLDDAIPLSEAREEDVVNILSQSEMASLCEKFVEVSARDKSPCIERDKEIVLANIGGEAQWSIAKRYGLSRNSVHVIVGRVSRIARERINESLRSEWEEINATD